MTYNLELIKQGLKRKGRYEHPENENIHVFQDKDFEKNNPLITEFSPTEKSNGYKKIFLSDDAEAHAEAYILLDKKTKDGRNIVVYFTQTKQKFNDKAIDALGGNFLLIGNKLDQYPIIGSGCVEYAISVLQNFDGKVWLKTEKGFNKTKIDQIQDGQEFITEQQIKLYHSRQLLEQFKIDPYKFQVTDSLDRIVTLEEYKDKYTIIGEDKKGELVKLNKKLNLETVGSRGIEKKFSPPRPNSGKNIERFHQNIEKFTKKSLEDYFPGTQAKDFIENSKAALEEYNATPLKHLMDKKREDQPQQKEVSLKKNTFKTPEIQKEKPRLLNRETIKPNKLNALSKAAHNFGHAKNAEDVKTSDLNSQNKHNIHSTKTKLPAINNQNSNSGTQQNILPKIRSR